MTKRRMAAVVGILAAIVLGSGFSGCARSTPLWQKRGGPPRVVVTIPALDSFVRNVGGDHVALVCLCTTKGPHHYEYTPDDAILMRDADLFFAIGLTLDEKFADPIQRESHNARLRYVELGERLPKELLRKGEEHEHEHGKEEAKHEHAHEHEHGEYDPHVWLGIPQAIAMVEVIRDELKKVDSDPAHQADYDKNAAAYIETLKKLHADGKAKLKDKKNRKIIAFHESLGYFADSFDLKIVDAIEMAPGQEASPTHLAKLVKKCKDEDVRVIAVEPQYQQGSSAKVLKEEVNNQVKKNIEFAVVDPLETADAKDLSEDGKELKSKDWYEKKMRENLDELAKKLP
jgi:zinc transport system substrate-binding protein